MPDSPSTNSNRARDHLANERTFLAWMRTALALMGFAAVIVRLRFLLPPELRGHAHSVWLSMAFAVLGFLIVPLSTWSYLSVQRGIERNEFKPNNGFILVFSATVALLGAGVLLYLFLTPALPSAR